MPSSAATPPRLSFCTGAYHRARSWHCDLNHITSFSTHRSARCDRPSPTEAAPHVADAVNDPRSSSPVVPRQKLPELYALASVREEAFANGTTPPPGVTLVGAE